MSEIKQNNPTLDINIYKQHNIPKVQEKHWHYKKEIKQTTSLSATWHLKVGTI